MDRGSTEESTVVCTDRGRIITSIKQEAVTRLSTALEVLASTATREETLDKLAAMALEMAAVSDDDLSGISNQWRLFNEMLGSEVCRADRGLSLVSVVLVEWTRAPSEEKISSALFDLRSALREYDELCRIEDRVLGLIMPGVSGKALIQVVDRLSRALTKRQEGLHIGYATWSPGQDVADLLAAARENLCDVRLQPRPIAGQHEPGVLLWLEDFPFALPVQAEPRADGLELLLNLPRATSAAQIRLRGGPVAVSCRLSDVSLTGATSLRFKVKANK